MLPPYYYSPTFHLPNNTTCGQKYHAPQVRYNIFFKLDIFIRWRGRDWLSHTSGAAAASVNVSGALIKKMQFGSWRPAFKPWLAYLCRLKTISPYIVNGKFPFVNMWRVLGTTFDALECTALASQMLRVRWDRESGRILMPCLAWAISAWVTSLPQESNNNQWTSYDLTWIQNQPVS